MSPLRTTRFSQQTGIKFRKMIDGLWMHIDTNEGSEAQVGPQYRSQAELLGDHEAYLKRVGWLTGEPAVNLNSQLVVRTQTTIFIPLPRALWRECGPCDCSHCKGAVGHWDTMAVAAKADERPDITWLVHMPTAQRA